MRRFLTCAPMILLLLLLVACGRDGKAEERALAIRTQLVGAETCSMEADVKADYGDRRYDFTLSFAWKKAGESLLTVLAPENIAGVTAVLDKGQTALTYEGARLETGTLSPDGLSPLDALPVLLTQCREGYISDAGFEKLGKSEAVAVTYGEPDKDQTSSVTYRIWFDVTSGAPLQAEVLSEGKSILQCTYRSFSFS